MDWSGCTEGAAKVATLKCIPVIFGNLINAALVFAGIVAVIFVILAGYKYLTSGGDAKKLESAQKTLTYTILGLVLIVASFLIVNLISYVTGVTCIQSIGLGKCDGGGGGGKDGEGSNNERCGGKNQKPCTGRTGGKSCDNGFELNKNENKCVKK